MVIVARPVVREDPQFLRIASFTVAGKAQGCTILTGVVVVILTLHSLVVKEDAAVFTHRSSVVLRLVFGAREQLHGVLAAEPPEDAKPQQLAQELEERVAGAVADEDLRLEL